MAEEKEWENQSMNTKHTCSNLRDDLAKERTVMANERTLLAYVRTAIMLLASGITLIKLLRVDTELRLLGWALVPLSVAVAAAGYRKYLKVRKELKQVNSAGC